VAHSLRVKLPDREIDHLLPSSTEVKNEWRYTSPPPICSTGADRNKYLLFVIRLFVKKSQVDHIVHASDVSYTSVFITHSFYLITLVLHPLKQA
jgi:hypothetical protein